MPITSPARLNTGPPELSGFGAMSVSKNGNALPSGSRCDVALTMPAVTVLPEPSGAPIVITGSPARTFDESPTRTNGSFVALTRNTATSLCESTASTVALNSRRSVSRTVTSLASATTCAEVRISPSALTMKPEPLPDTARGDVSGAGACGCACWPCAGGGASRRKNAASGSSGSRIAKDGPPACCSGAAVMMVTTAGP
ncbi:hypothetical protein BME24068_03861 [Burkholderia metallica]|nr:hypothetical protein BME24068_03861 [Burkholderia metallica]